jgi:hypothetical protein
MVMRTITPEDPLVLARVGALTGTTDYPHVADESARVALVGDGSGVRFEPNKGTPWKEWFSLDLQSELAWSALAREALEFARN